VVHLVDAYFHEKGLDQSQITSKLTFTLTVPGINWLQQAAFNLGAGKSMGDVTRAIRNALEKQVTY